MNRLMNDADFLKIAISEAKSSVEEGGFPAGSIIVKNGEIIGRGKSIGNIIKDPTSHGEISAIRDAGKKNIDLLNDSVLYTSLKPCLMCFSASNWAGIKKIVYGYEKNDDLIKKQYYEGSSSLEEINLKNNRQIELVYISDFKEVVSEIIENWEKQNI